MTFLPAYRGSIRLHNGESPTRTLQVLYKFPQMLCTKWEKPKEGTVHDKAAGVYTGSTCGEDGLSMGGSLTYITYGPNSWH